MDPKGTEAKVRKESEKTALSQSENKGKGWFLTYPQCPMKKEVVLECLKERLTTKYGLGVVEYVICEENHENGDPHIHAFIKVDKRIRFTKDRFDLDDLGATYHGNYQIAKSWRAVAQYVTKDGNYISNIDLKAAKNKQAKKIGVAELERDALELLEEGVISGFQLTNFIKNQNTYKLLKNKRKAAQNIDLNIEKKRHIWMYGESNSGKTYRLKTEILKDPENWFQIPTNNDWIGYNGEKYLYLDEFKGQLSIQELNRICDGGTKVNVKGGTTVLASDVVVYIVSNYNIKDCFKKVEEPILETLYNRFNEKYCQKSGDQYEII